MTHALDSRHALGHASPMTDDAPKRGRGRPRIHPDTGDANRARARAHMAAKRASAHERVAYLDDATSARADALMAERGLPTFSALVEDLVRAAPLASRDGQL